jgi:pilus assembly protein Flp/PilA
MLEMIMSFVYRMRDREEGQALVEYALILALVSIVSVAALTALGLNVAGALQNIADEIAGAL